MHPAHAGALPTEDPADVRGGRDLIGGAMAASELWQLGPMSTVVLKRDGP